MKSLENHLNIDLTALEHNLKEIKKKIFPSKVMAVVKSNAYGHGMLAVAKRLEKKVAYFFVDKLDQYQLEWALADFATLEVLEKNPPKIKTKIHIKIKERKEKEL